MPPQNMPIWHKDDFEQTSLRNCRHRSSENRVEFREIYIRKGDCTWKCSNSRDHSSTWLICMAEQTLPTISSTHLPVNCLPPIWNPAPIPLLFSVWYISLSCRAAFWVSFLCGAPTWPYVFKVVLFFLLLIFNYGRGEGCLSQEPSRVEGKIFFLLYSIKRNV